GSALLTLGVGLLGAYHEHRRLLLAAASLMIATGVALAAVHDYALLLVVAIAGTINPSAGSVSVFVPLEHAVLAREVSDRERTKMFSRYSLIGALAGAFGGLAAATPDLLGLIGMDQVTAIKAMFVLYALLGVGGALIYASVCLIFAAISPTLSVAMVLLLIRAALSQMDVPTRSSYVMAVVTEAERTAAAS